MTVYIDEEECIGCSTSEEICPEVFKLNPETEKAEVILPEGGPEYFIEEAMDNCPSSCIYYEEEYRTSVDPGQGFVPMCR